MRQLLPARTREQQQYPIGRLLKHCDYANAYKAGRNVTKALFKVYAVANDLNCTRVGIVVSRRVSPQAVVRNRIKRIIRHYVRGYLPPALCASFDIVIVARPSAVCANMSKQLRTGLKHIFDQWYT